jgi:hypothetical protein
MEHHLITLVPCKEHNCTLNIQLKTLLKSVRKKREHKLEQNPPRSKLQRRVAAVDPPRRSRSSQPHRVVGQITAGVNPIPGPPAAATIPTPNTGAHRSSPATYPSPRAPSALYAPSPTEIRKASSERSRETSREVSRRTNEAARFPSRFGTPAGHLAVVATHSPPPPPPPPLLCSCSSLNLPPSRGLSAVSSGFLARPGTAAGAHEGKGKKSSDFSFPAEFASDSFPLS